MKNRYYIITLIMVLMLLSLFALSVRAAPEIEFTFEEEVDPKLVPIAEYYHHEVVQAWHHSGGYWQNEKTGDRVDDDDLNGDLRHLERYLVPVEGYPIKFTLPYEVIQAYNEGKKIVSQAESKHSGIQIGQMLKFIDEPDEYMITINGNQLSAMIHPKFNFEEAFGSLVSFNDYDFGLSEGMPFVRQMFGSNVYSLYNKNGSSRGKWAASSNYVYNSGAGLIGMPMNQPSGLQSMINADGTLRPGYSINTTLGNSASDSFRIGQSSGVFKAAGGLGLSFNYPINFKFYVEGEGQSDMIMTEFELVEKATGKVIDSLRRTVNSVIQMFL